MAELLVEDQRLVVELSAWERIGAVRRTDVEVPLDKIASVERLENARDGIRGLRAPGTGLPGVIALGTWRTRRTVDFVAVSKNDPGYLIELDGHRFDRIVVSSPPVAELEAISG